MLPGFVSLGLLAIGIQMLVVASVAMIIRVRLSVPPEPAATRGRRIAGVGVAFAVAGQLAALLALGSLRMGPWLSLETAIRVQNIGLLVAALGYLGFVAGGVMYLRGVPGEE